MVLSGWLSPIVWCGAFGGRENNQCFEDSERAIADLKLLFFKTLLDWMSIIGSHSIFSVYDLMDTCNLCVWLFWSPAVYLVDSFLWLCIKFSLLIKKKKKKTESHNLVFVTCHFSFNYHHLNDLLDQFNISKDWVLCWLTRIIVVTLFCRSFKLDIIEF